MLDVRPDTGFAKKFLAFYETTVELDEFERNLIVKWYRQCQRSMLQVISILGAN